MAVTPLFTSSELELRIGSIKFHRVLDENNTGMANPATVAQLISDASATVWSYLPKDYSVSGGVPEYLRKLALDVGQALAYIRHPEFRRDDAHDLMRMAHKDLERFKKQVTAIPGVTRTDTYAVISSTAANDSGNDWIR